MNPPHMILHIIHATEHPRAILPFTQHPGVMFGLVPRAVLLAREPRLGRLRTSLVSAEEVFAVSIEMFAEIAAAAEDGLRGAAWVGAAPGAVGAGWDADVVEVVACRCCCCCCF